MARNDLFKLLNAVDKGVGRTYGPNGALSRLFRQILLNRNIGPEKFGSLMYDYLKDPRNHIPSNRKDMTSARGNLGMALAQPSMTWKVLCKGFKFLKIVKIDISIRAHYANGHQEIHRTSVTLTEVRAADSKYPTHSVDQSQTGEIDANEDFSNDSK